MIRSIVPLPRSCLRYWQKSSLVILERALSECKPWGNGCDTLFLVSGIKLRRRLRSPIILVIKKPDQTLASINIDRRLWFQWQSYIIFLSDFNPVFIVGNNGKGLLALRLTAPSFGLQDYLISAVTLKVQTKEFWWAVEYCFVQLQIMRNQVPFRQLQQTHDPGAMVCEMPCTSYPFPPPSDLLKPRTTGIATMIRTTTITSPTRIHPFLCPPGVQFSLPMNAPSLSRWFWSGLYPFFDLRPTFTPNLGAMGSRETKT